MKDLIILKQEIPAIDCNFEEVKKDLQIRLEEYTKLVVTADSLTFCKSEQKHLAGLKRKVDDYRKKIKNEMLVPITAFEGKCKELVNLIADTEAPIKEGIKVFDDERKELKRQHAISEMFRVKNEFGLNEKFSGQMFFHEKYMNLTAKGKDVTADIEAQGTLLLAKQNREDDVIETVKSTVERVNETIINKLSIWEFSFLVDLDNSMGEIITIIEDKANKVKENEEEVKRKTIEHEAEKKALEETKIKVVEGANKIEEVKPEVITKPEIETPRIYTYNMDISGNIEQLKKLKEFMTLNNISYEVKNN